MLKVDALSAGYGRGNVLNGLSLEARAGEVVCLLGRNGVGKTTALKTIAGLLGKRSGSVRLRDVELGGLPSHVIARHGVGYVPETRLVFPNLTVAENLSMGLWRGAHRYAAASERVLHYFPRLRDKLREAGRALSGGEQQMLSIARALMAEPQLLLVDDPTEGLAPVIVDALEETIRALADAGTTVLLVESKLAVARRVADRIYVVAKGTAVFHGTARELDANPDVRRQYLEV
jgi:branched-chain amino acid transport system ATP-binding protein